MSGSRHDSLPDESADIWAFSERVSTWLFNWNMLNLAAGLILQRGGKLSRAVGGQNIGWSLINFAIALLGSQSGRKRKAALVIPDDPEVQHREKRNLTRVLWLNWGLDFLYIVGGARFASGGNRPSPWRVGTGLGIMIQGALLLIFDTLLLRRLQTPSKTPWNTRSESTASSTESMKVDGHATAD